MIDNNRKTSFKSLVFGKRNLKNNTIEYVVRYPNGEIILVTDIALATRVPVFSRAYTDETISNIRKSWNISDEYEKFIVEVSMKLID